MKKRIFIILLCVLVFAVGAIFAGCANADNIYNISREEGSGTRSAFEEFIKIGKDEVVVQQGIQSATANVINIVKQSPNAIGYISLGNLPDSVKALDIEGVKASAENINNGTYKMARPFVAVYNLDAIKDENTKALILDFISFLESEQAASIMKEEGFVVTRTGLATYAKSSLSGSLKLGGSTSCEDLVDKKLAAEYERLNDKAITVDYDGTGSGTGISSAKDGLYHIGFASKAVSDPLLINFDFCLDGIAVIVNKKNALDNITLSQLKDIYTGKVTKYSELA